MILLSVCSGIVTNYKEVKVFLLKKGYQFESETDTEIIAKLVHHIYLQNPNCSFRELIEQVIQQLVRIWRICLYILTASCTEVPISLSINVSTRIYLLIKLYSPLISVFWQVPIWYLWPLCVSHLNFIPLVVIYLISQLNFCVCDTCPYHCISLTAQSFLIMYLFSEFV